MNEMKLKQNASKPVVAKVNPNESRIIRADAAP